MYEKHKSQSPFPDSTKDCWGFVSNFLRNIKRFICCDYSPRTLRDKLSLLVLLLNIGSIAGFTFVAVKVLTPWWIGFSIGSWLLIIELTFFMFVKFY